jgi:hypothetical protein
MVLSRAFPFHVVHAFSTSACEEMAEERDDRQLDASGGSVLITFTENCIKPTEAKRPRYLPSLSVESHAKMKCSRPELSSVVKVSRQRVCQRLLVVASSPWFSARVREITVLYFVSSVESPRIIADLSLGQLQLHTLSVSRLTS